MGIPPPHLLDQGAAQRPAETAATSEGLGRDSLRWGRDDSERPHHCAPRHAPVRDDDARQVTAGCEIGDGHDGLDDPASGLAGLADNVIWTYSPDE